MDIDRRALRRSLGTRTARRAGTKSKCIAGKERAGCKTPEFKYPRCQRMRPKAHLARLIREAEAKT